MSETCLEQADCDKVYSALGLIEADYKHFKTSVSGRGMRDNNGLPGVLMWRRQRSNK